MNLVRVLAEEGLRVFSSQRARELSARAGLRVSYTNEALHHLEASGWIVRIRRGLYALTEVLPGITPAHEYEIAMALAGDAMISHHSALHFHGLTDQIPSRVYVSVSVGKRAPSPSGGSTVRAGGFEYRFVRLRPERHFGGVERWIGESRVTFTDPERTLLDGVSRPGYCGDFGEVLNAFRGARSAIDIPKICEYALRLDDATAKRLGWILQNLGCREADLEPLLALDIRGYRNLDPEGPNEGPHDSRWMIRVNLPGRRSP